VAPLGAASQFLGQLAVALGRPLDAARHFEDALELNRNMGMTQAVARTEVEYADLLLAGDDPAVRGRALALLNHAIAAGSERGMKMLVERALALKLRAQGITDRATGTSIDTLVRTIRSDPPHLATEVTASGAVTIVFTDIEDFTSFVTRLGDESAQAILREHNAVIRAEVAAHGGTVVKSQGDGFMLAFADPLAALRGAMAIQQRLAEYNAAHDLSVRVRVGVHRGSAIREADDFFGTTVILTARIADTARGGQILVSSDVHDIARGELAFGPQRDVELHGFPEKVRVFELGWE
jgi:class 3 adenylate cyclase